MGVMKKKWSRIFCSFCAAKRSLTLEHTMPNNQLVMNYCFCKNARKKLVARLVPYKNSMSGQNISSNKMKVRHELRVDEPSGFVNKFFAVKIRLKIPDHNSWSSSVVFALL